MMQRATSGSAQSRLGGQSFPTWVGDVDSQPPDIEKEISRALLADTSGETSQTQSEETLQSKTHERRQYISPSTGMLLPGVSELPNRLPPPPRGLPKISGPAPAPVRSRFPADPNGLSPGDYVIAAYNYNSRNPTILNVHKDDRIELVGKPVNGWLDGVLHGRRGWCPSNYCDIIVHDNADRIPSTRDPGVNGSVILSENSLPPAGLSDYKMHRQDLDSRYRCRVKECLQSLQGQRFVKLEDFYNHCDDVHRNIPSSKESFEVVPRKENGSQPAEFLRSHGGPDSNNGSAVTAESMLQVRVRRDLSGSPFKCSFNKCELSPSACFTDKEDLRSHLNSVHGEVSEGFRQWLMGEKSEILYVRRI